MFKSKVYLTLIVVVAILALGSAGLSRAATANHLVISEVQITGGTGKTNNDFIELYNPTASAINLNGYRLVKRTKTGNSDTLIKSWTSDTSIAAHGFYLWANSDYADIPTAPDVVTTASIADDNGVAIRRGANDTGEIIDSVGWGECQNIFVETTAYPNNPGANQSFIRKPGGDQGNGDDTNDNSQDFTASSSPSPQNTNSSPEPAISGPVCGNSICEAGEDSSTCSTDCPNNNSNNNIEIYIPYKVQAGDILINEIFPEPNMSKGENEWIEFYNRTDAAINLTGWTLEDNTAKPVILVGVILAPHQYYVLEKSNFSFVLNNGGDILILKNNQTVIDRVAYGDYEDGSIEDNAPMPGPSKSVGRKDIEPINTNNNHNDFAISAIITPGRVNSVEVASAYPAPVNYSNAAVTISEFLANPDGDDNNEWIELYNSGSAAIDLNGWQVDDGEGGSSPYILPSGTVISAGGYLVLPRLQTKIALNNDFDAVRLIRPDKTIQNQINYKDPPEGASYARDSVGSWQYTTSLTPGSVNVFNLSDAGEATNETTSAQGLDASSNEDGLTEVDSLPQTDSGQVVVVRGLVLAPPGLFAKSYFYINGAQIYYSIAKFPDLQIGDLIETKGTVSTSFSNRRLKIKSADDIKVLGHQNIDPQPVTIGELDESLVGHLLQINGRLVEKTGNKLYLDDNQAESEIYLSAAIKWNKKLFSEGQDLQVTGVLVEAKDGWRLLPRSDNDLVIIAATDDSLLNSNEDLTAIDNQNNLGVNKLASSTATIWQNLNHSTNLKFLSLSAGIIVIFLVGVFLKLKGLI